MSSAPHRVETPVLIVGGSIVGLSLSLFLAQHGVPALTVERHAGTALHPRARLFHPRTIELFRASGVASHIEALGGLPIDAAEAWSPARTVYLGQDRMEPLVLDAARAAGADIRFGCELVSWRHEGQAVLAALVNRVDGEVTEVRTRFLVAADGVDSSVRKQLGILQSGRGSMGHNLAILFEADLSNAMTAPFMHVTHPQAAGVLVVTDIPGRYIYSIDYDPQRERPEDFTKERWAARLSLATGLRSVEPRITGTFPWEVAERVAERFSVGPVFLVGDAAHQMPPMGAFGANTGIHDAANLAWKLAYVARGEAGAALLETYHSERQPVARATAEHATVSALRMREEGQQATRDIILPDEACVMRTYRYGATPPIPLQLTAADEQGQVGSRLPHFWLNAEQTRSSIDLCKQRFVLISPDLRWADAAARSSSDFAHLSQSADALALGPHGAALVRPDHVVGARWQALPNDPAGELARAIVALLGRSQEA